MNLELQQRAVEYHAIIKKHDNLRDGLFEQMPAIELKISYANANSTTTNNVDQENLYEEFQSEEDKKKEQERFKEEAAKTLIDIFSDDTLGPISPTAAAQTTNVDHQANKPKTSSTSDFDILNFLEQPAVTQTQTRPQINQNNDLDSIFSVPSATTLQTQPQHHQKSNADILDIFNSNVTNPPKPANNLTLNGLEDLLGGGFGSQPIPSQAKNNSNDLLNFLSISQINGGLVKPKSSSILTAYEKNDLKIVFETTPGKTSTLEQSYLQVKADNLSVNNFVKDFSFSAAVPKTMQIQITPPNSTVMQPLESLALMVVISNPKKVRKPIF